MYDMFYFTLRKSKVPYFKHCQKSMVFSFFVDRLSFQEKQYAIIFSMLSSILYELVFSIEILVCDI